MLKAQDRVRRALHIDQDVAEISPQIRVKRFELHRLVEGLESLFVPPLVRERGAEVRQVICFWLLPDRTRYPLHGMVVLFGVEGKETHQVQGVRVVGIHGKRLLAAKLGVEMPSCLHVAEAGLIERSDRCRPASSQADSGFLGGCPALATAHRRTSKMVSVQ